jgi:hypothetical protein
VPVLRLACVLAFALPALAADPVRPAVKKLYGLHTPRGWMLDIHDDGSARLVFGDGAYADSYSAPAGTFKPDDVRRALDGVKLDPKGGEGTHFVAWYEEERKGPADAPRPRYTTDERVIVPLFEAAAAAGKRKDHDALKALGGKRPGFGLKGR